MTNIEKTVRAVQSCNSWLCYYKITAEFCFGEHEVLLNSKQSQSNTDFSFTSVNIKFTIGMNFHFFFFFFFEWGAVSISQEVPWSSGLSGSVMVQKVAVKREFEARLRHTTTANFCQPNSKWVPFSD